MSADTPMGRPALDSGTEDGIRWVTLVAPVWGGVNGYAQVPDGHPWSGKGYHDIDPDVHGGLTYANDGWVGFDTMHGDDYWPGMPEGFENGHHWTTEEVAEEARSLARQVAAAAKAVAR